MNAVYIRDVFEELTDKAADGIMSNLKYMPWKKEALEELSKMDMSQYPMSSLNELADYMFSEKQKFVKAEEASKYFSEKLSSYTVKM